MDVETLNRCRRIAVAKRRATEALKEHKASAGCIGGMRYGDTPHGRGERLSPEQSYVEQGERLEYDLKRCQNAMADAEKELKCLTAQLPPLQRQLIEEYYISGYEWGEINARHKINHGKSRYQHLKALEKILDKS